MEWVFIRSINDVSCRGEISNDSEVLDEEEVGMDAWGELICRGEAKSQEDCPVVRRGESPSDASQEGQVQVRRVLQLQ